ncbi:MAG: hypothetical protein ABW133_26000 [Polyangiaceae bacterium]
MSSPKSELSFVQEARGVRPLRTRGFALLGALAGLLVSGTANAQVDSNPPLQNVMLLVDTSGSMEYAIDGSKVSCDNVDATLTTEPKATSQKNRWTQLVEVLTGDVTNYTCYTQDRSSDAFRDEFRLAGNNSYDYRYHVPYHRIVSGTSGTGGLCTIGAGVADANPFLWGSTPWKYHLYSSAGTACTNFLQAETGLLDAYRDRVRFGLMTFDGAVNAGTGLNGTAADYVSANDGTWSYFLNWRSNPTCASNASCAKGRPAGCAESSIVEVGARNAAAPPWEGRMVPFGSPVADIADVRTTNQRIQNVLTSVRPWGATPIDGLLSDARDYFRNDVDPDYVNGATTCDNNTGLGCFGPSKDGYVKQGCRKNYIILLTDGEPNLNLRPSCEGTISGIAGACPYVDKSFDVVKDLAAPSSSSIAPVKTYVIGFAVSNVDAGQPAPVDCSKISTQDSMGTTTFDPKGLCGASMDPKLATCCTLAKIAFYGGSVNAAFVSNATELRGAMANILRDIDSKVSTRTMPVFASASNETNGGAYSFYTSFRADRADVWAGVLERQRTKCVPETTGGSTIIKPTDLPIDGSLGDKFSENVAAADSSRPRTFYTVLPTAVSGLQYSDRTIRPSIPSSNPDGLGTQSGTLTSGTVTDFFAPKIPATAMKVTKSACTDKPVPATDDLCAAMFMKWELGIDNTPYVKRANPFGAIYHSTPTLVGAPSDFLRDESYSQFMAEQNKRPPMLYMSTTDGQLHAFKVDVSPNDPADTFKIDKRANNELWSFFPPAALPRIPAQYPGIEQVITDGVPVVKNVVFERTAADSKSGGGSAKWRTVLVSGFGGGGPGYFALDVTNPVIKSNDSTTGPKMLWQITTDDAGNRLFGKRGGTPAIATLFFGAGGVDPKEVAVAILPGGDSDSPAAGACNQLGTSDLVDSTKTARTKVRCWANDPARSLTIVRLDTGEVVRSFRADTDGPASILPRSRNGSSQYTALNAPISGQPVPFPSMGGEVSDRAFVGDRDGMLWRVDFASPNPQEWKMQLFFDAYTGQGSSDGQPIATPPILSVDRLGNVTIAFSTGDQETFLATTGMKNYVWSLIEKPSGTPPVFKSEAQWSLLLKDGERVSGPMSLFSSSLFYTTYTPPPFGDTRNCSAGQSRICGVHYLLPRGNAGEGGAVGRPLLNTETDPCLQFGESIIFGAGITQRPTCNQEQTYNDPYLGTQNHSQLINVNPGKFNLIVQTGPSGNKPTGGEVNTRTIELQPPLTSTRIDSWAAVVE